MPRKRGAGEPAWTDPDDAPELTDAFFERADVYEAGQLVRRGRPKLEKPKRQVTLRLDAEVVEGLRGAGPGWQTRANAALAEWLARNGVRRAGS
jgi:uncharacterized protein (DUF4415 family)